MTKFKFIDLFCGIGGFHQALQNLGGECVLASDIDKYAIESYKENYGKDVRNVHADLMSLRNTFKTKESRVLKAFGTVSGIWYALYTSVK